jgi:hypothetical protein
MKGQAAISDWIFSLASGDRDRAAALLSDEFGMHDGMDAVAYLNHEISEFRERREGFGLPARPEILIKPEGDGAYLIHVLTDHGHLAYEDRLHVDRDGKIVGNGRPLEIITKLAFSTALERPVRAMAIRGHREPIRSLTPLFPTKWFSFMPAGTFSIDGFHVAHFDEGEESPKTEARSFRFLIGNRGVSVHAVMRGIDHPFFSADRFPRISGRRVHIDLSRGPIWSVTARLRDGSVRSVDCPRIETLEFETDVLQATVTDAVDNDWEGRA